MATLVYPEEKVLGYLLYEYDAEKTHIRIHRFAVDPAYQRCGVGSKMVIRLIEKMVRMGCAWITVDVPESCLSAQLFLRKHGFRATRVDRQFYEDTGEDAFTMVYQPEEQS